MKIIQVLKHFHSRIQTKHLGFYSLKFIKFIATALYAESINKCGLCFICGVYSIPDFTILDGVDAQRSRTGVAVNNMWFY